jgi:phosphatidylglycerophosphatase A
MSDAAPIRPDWAFMRGRLSRVLALGFGSGLSPIAPGTVGTLWAWIVFQPLASWLSPPALLALCAVGFVVGIWACGRTAEALGVADHGAIVWDEVIAFWLVLTLAPGGFVAQLMAFALFRLFDIVKPPPIRYFDATIKNGFGVMFDDLLAAFYALLVIALWRALT